MKKVRFDEHVIVHIVPVEDRKGYWASDACRFKDKILKVEQAIKWCLMQKQQKYIYII